MVVQCVLLILLNRMDDGMTKMQRYTSGFALMYGFNVALLEFKGILVLKEERNLEGGL